VEDELLKAGHEQVPNGTRKKEQVKIENWGLR
jgi:hypothetical protein